MGDHCVGFCYNNGMEEQFIEDQSFKGIDFLSTPLKFEDTNLQQADFRGVIHFDINPEHNTITGAKFNAAFLGGLLTKHQLIINHN